MNTFLEKEWVCPDFEDSEAGKVPDIKLIHITRCGLVMKQGSQFIRDSVDGNAFEHCESSKDAREDFDPISSHLIKCKCRSGSDGSLKKAQQTQNKLLLSKEV